MSLVRDLPIWGAKVLPKFFLCKFLAVFCFFFNKNGLGNGLKVCRSRGCNGHNQVILALDGNWVMCAGAVAYNPDDIAVGFKQPCVLLLEMIQFEVVEEVAHEFASSHAEGLESVSASPVAQHNVLAVEYLRAECDTRAGAHPWREGGAAVMYGDVNRAFNPDSRVKGYFIILRGREVLDDERLPVDD